MKPTRRKFVSTMAMAALGARYVRAAAARLPLAFSTLGCPGWTWPQILDFAEQHGFRGRGVTRNAWRYEFAGAPGIRGGQIQCCQARRGGTRMKIACVAARRRCTWRNRKSVPNNSPMRESFIDLAAALGAPYVRVFGNKMEGPREEVIARVSSGLHELGEVCGAAKCNGHIESHGDFTDSRPR